MKNKIGLIGALFVFALFAFMSLKTPLAGDDWGYALNGQSGNVFKTAFDFYMNWSGRFFSELYGFIFASNKWAWNILNPLLFASIFYLSFQLSAKTNKWLRIVVIIFLMLSVNEHLRMETYSWIMGTTYVIPLAITLFYLSRTEKIFKDGLSSNKEYYIAILLFVAGLMMENISAALVFLSVLLIFFAKKDKKYFIINAITSSIAFALLRLSPGANFRLLRDNAAWAELSIFEKMEINFPLFIKYTFIENKFIIFTIGLGVLALILIKIYQSRKIKLTDLAFALVFGVSIISSMALTLSSRLSFINFDFMLDPSSLFNYIFWIVYMATIIIFTWLHFDGLKRNKMVLLILLAGLSNGVMLASPIFGARSAVYSVYFMIIYAAIIYSEIKVHKYIYIMVSIIFLALVLAKTRTYVYKYNLVGKVQAERLEIYDYYRTNLDDQDAWIPRMPIFTVHGADIEEGDDYHFEVFKKYYNLPEDLNVTFFFKDEY